MPTGRSTVFQVGDSGAALEFVHTDGSLKGQGTRGDPLGIRGALSAQAVSAYSPSATYAYGALVSKGTHAFISVQNNNLGFDPFVNQDRWRAIDSLNILPYTSGLTMYRGDVVMDPGGGVWLNVADFGVAVNGTPRAGDPRWFSLSGGGGSGGVAGVSGWQSSVQYSAGDFVLYDNQPWVALLDNRNHVPETSAEFWAHIDRSNVLERDANATYRRGQIVESNDRYWLVVADEGVGVTSVPASGSDEWQEIGGTGFTQDQVENIVDAEIMAQIPQWARDLTTDIPAIKLGNAPVGVTQAQAVQIIRAQVSPWALVGNTDPLPPEKVPGGGGGGLDTAAVDARIVAKTYGWSQQGNPDPLPAAKLVNAPAGAQGRYRLWLFQTASVVPSAPVAGYDGSALSNLGNWSDTLPAEIPDEEQLYASTAEWNPSTATLGAWSRPLQWSTASGAEFETRNLMREDAAPSNFLWNDWRLGTLELEHVSAPNSNQWAASAIPEQGTLPADITLGPYAFTSILVQHVGTAEKKVDIRLDSDLGDEIQSAFVLYVEHPTDPSLNRTWYGDLARDTAEPYVFTGADVDAFYDWLNANAHGEDVKYRIALVLKADYPSLESITEHVVERGHRDSTVNLMRVASVPPGFDYGDFSDNLKLTDAFGTLQIWDAATVGGVVPADYGSVGFSDISVSGSTVNHRGTVEITTDANVSLQTSRAWVLNLQVQGKPHVHATFRFGIDAAPSQTGSYVFSNTAQSNAAYRWVRDNVGENPVVYRIGLVSKTRYPDVESITRYEEVTKKLDIGIGGTGTTLTGGTMYRVEVKDGDFSFDNWADAALFAYFRGGTGTAPPWIEASFLCAQLGSLDLVSGATAASYTIAEVDFLGSGSNPWRGDEVLACKTSYQIVDAGDFSHSILFVARGDKEHVFYVGVPHNRGNINRSSFGLYALRSGRGGIGGGVVVEGGDGLTEPEARALIAPFARFGSTEPAPGATLANGGAKAFDTLASMRAVINSLTLGSVYWVEDIGRWYEVIEHQVHPFFPIRMTFTDTDVSPLSDDRYGYTRTGYIPHITAATAQPQGSLALAPNSEGVLGTDIEGIVQMENAAGEGDLAVVMNDTSTFIPKTIKVRQPNGHAATFDTLTEFTQLSSAGFKVYLVGGTYSTAYSRIIPDHEGETGGTIDIDLLDADGVSYAPTLMTARDVRALDQHVGEAAFAEYGSQEQAREGRSFVDPRYNDTYISQPVEATPDVIVEPTSIGDGKHGYAASTPQAVSKSLTHVAKGLSWNDREIELLLPDNVTDANTTKSVVLFKGADLRERGDALTFQRSTKPALHPADVAKLHFGTFDPGSHHPRLLPKTSGNEVGTAGAGSELTGFPGGDDTKINWDTTDRKWKVAVELLQHADDKQVIRGQRIRLEDVGTGVDRILAYTRDYAVGGHTLRGEAAAGQLPVIQDIEIRLGGDAANKAQSYVHIPYHADYLNNGDSDPALGLVMRRAHEDETAPNENETDPFADVSKVNIFLLEFDRMLTSEPDMAKYTFRQLGGSPLPWNVLVSEGWHYVGLVHLDRADDAGNRDFGFSYYPQEYEQLVINGVRIPISVSRITWDEQHEPSVATMHYESAAYHADQVAPVEADERVHVNLESVRGVTHGHNDRALWSLPRHRAVRLGLQNADGETISQDAKQWYWDLQSRGPKTSIVQQLTFPSRDHDLQLLGERYWRSSEETLDGFLFATREEPLQAGATQQVIRAHEIHEGSVNGKASTSILVEDIYFEVVSGNQYLFMEYAGSALEGQLTIQLFRHDDGHYEYSSVDGATSVAQADVDRKTWTLRWLVNGDYKANQMVRATLKHAQEPHLTYPVPTLVWRPT